MPRVLLIRARTADDPMREHELACFVKWTGLREEQIVPHDLYHGPPTWAQLRPFDALMVGGSGEYYVSKRNAPQFEALLELMRRVADEGHPTFASCFGYQCMVEALGGKILFDPERTEVGTFEVTLTPEGEKDELFGTLPATFLAQMGHKDRALRPPPGLANLARSELCPFQALRVPGKPVWASQFHPELDREDNLVRYRRYLYGYAATMTEEEQQARLRSFQESPVASQLLGWFVDRVLGRD